ncbi:MAG: DPP IV N-terminal domain-containing protein [Acidobacteriota bacterium]
MKPRHLLLKVATIGCLLVLPALADAQGKLADYERAGELRKRFQELAINVPERATWIENTSRVWYRRSTKDGNEFVLVDAETRTKKPAFDHERLAASLSAATGEKYTAGTLPFTAITFVDSERTLEFTVGETRWRCDLSDYTNKKQGPAFPGFFSGRQVLLGRTLQPWGGSQQTMPQEQFKPSPDGKWEAFIRNYNVFVRAKGEKDEFPLSFEGSEGNYYAAFSITWSPDSKKLVAYRIQPGHRRKIQYVQSSPNDQLQPKYLTLDYAKPGDALDIERPVLFQLEGRKQFVIDNGPFPDAFGLTAPVWRKDSRAFTFEYNQRGHQIYRVIEADASTGKTRAVIDEQAKTFFCYSGKKYRYDVADGKEVVWMSERDGWNHLYLFDGVTGAVKNQITRGEWVVRGVEKVDEEKRQIWFRASGMYKGTDPYFNQFYRISFDGSGLTAFTDEDANHTVSLSPDMKFYVDTWSRVDLPPVSVLRSVADKSIVLELERVDITELAKSGWRAPEVFTATGRDGKTGIWGVIYKPMNFDPAKKYAVIENIYAGPHDSFVPKSFSAHNQMQSLAEIGFIVVQIDGMGTSNRSKAFHDVSWKNLGDAGFADRILWHRAVAAKYAYYDISRAGIYGTSAGGQSSLGGLLFHPEFYKVCVSSAGCHDNRMDKIWWNEQWMGWPLGPEYAASSNVTNAAKLQGKLLLIVGELDPNVDPASTMQVVNALITAKKKFDLLVIPGAPHNNGGPYGDRLRYDFFVHHLLGLEPPDWNAVAESNTEGKSDR